MKNIPGRRSKKRRQSKPGKPGNRTYENGVRVRRKTEVEHNGRVTKRKEPSGESRTNDAREASEDS